MRLTDHPPQGEGMGVLLLKPPILDLEGLTPLVPGPNPVYTQVLEVTLHVLGINRNQYQPVLAKIMEENSIPLQARILNGIGPSTLLCFTHILGQGENV